jgi:hypothetical protein
MASLLGSRGEVAAGRVARRDVALASGCNEVSLATMVIALFQFYNACVDLAAPRSATM